MSCYCFFSCPYHITIKKNYGVYHTAALLHSTSQPDTKHTTYTKGNYSDILITNGISLIFYKRINKKNIQNMLTCTLMTIRRALILVPLKVWATPTICYLNEKSWPLLNTRNFELQDPLHCLTRKLTSILCWTKLEEGNALEATSEMY